MLLLSDRLYSVPILSLQTGAELAVTGQPIIDPRQLQLVAFYCEGRLLNVQPAILHSTDIREVSDIGMIVDDDGAIMSPEGLVRLQEILDFGFTLIGIKVVDDQGHKLGTVSDFTTDTLNFLIQKLSVKRPLLKSFTTSELIIDRSQIIDVTNTKITVKAPTVTAKAVTGNAKATASFENPFRNSSPRPETEHISRPEA